MSNPIKVAVNVRFTYGSYIARGGGKTASCTSGRDRAVVALARKLFPGREDFSIKLVRVRDADVGLHGSTWQITLPDTEPHHAA